MRGLIFVAVVVATAGLAVRPETRAGAVQIEMRNVHLHLDDSIVLDISRLRGEMSSTVPDKPPNFDDAQSYVLHVRSAEMWLDMASLGNLMNRYMFAYPGAPLSGVSVRVGKHGLLEQKATLHKGLSVPISMLASVTTTPDGKLRLHVESQKALGVGTTTVMHLFGLHAGSLVHIDPIRGVSVAGDDIDIDIGKVLPPPRIVGRLTRADLDGDRLHQIIGTPEPRPLAPAGSPASNYVYFSGSTLRFGKLTMSDTDLQLIDQDARDPFDFFPRRYQAQLVAGYSKNTPSGGLRTFMPDYRKVR